MTVTSLKEHVTPLLHGSTLNKVRNFYSACERAANVVLLNIDPVESIRTTPLARVIHDDLNNYPLPSDFGKVIDLYPQDDRTSLDAAQRTYAERFARRVSVANKEITIEGSEGSKFLRVNWKSEPAVTLHAMNSLTTGGTISVVGSATGLRLQELYKLSGSGSIEFDLVVTGDGIQSTNTTTLDLEDWDELADIIFPVYIGDVTNLTSITFIFGNDLTTNYWTCVAQTAQADGTAFANGWNWIRCLWSTATETGTVDPVKIDSWRITIAATGALSNIRVDNIIFSLGRVFDIKYYSRFFFKNSAGTYLAQPTTDDDTVIGDGTLNQIYIHELVKECARQIEGEDSGFDISYANRELHGDPASPDPMLRIGLYGKYRLEFPSMSKKAVTAYSSGPRFRR